MVATELCNWKGWMRSMKNETLVENRLIEKKIPYCIVLHKVYSCLNMSFYFLQITMSDLRRLSFKKITFKMFFYFFKAIKVWETFTLSLERNLALLRLQNYIIINGLRSSEDNAIIR